MTDIKDKIIADLRHELADYKSEADKVTEAMGSENLRLQSELDTARAVIKVMEDNERLAEERHEHDMRSLRRLVDEWKEADAALKDAAEGDPETCHNAYDKFNKTEEALRHA